MKTLIFDGSFEGLLCGVFEAFEQKWFTARIVPQILHQPALIDESLAVAPDETRAARVWEGLKKTCGPKWANKLYTCYLSEDPQTFQHIFDFCIYVFQNGKGAQQNYGHPAVIGLTKMEKSVSRERHRMKAFVRFQETADGIFYAPVEPDYNVLPLIAGFFKNRYADQRWIIYDLKRRYGLYYNGEDVEEIRFEEQPALKNLDVLPDSSFLDDKEALYGLLWKDYFKSTNIPARKNTKLHVQHVPKRYWKYLTEKQDADAHYCIAVLPPADVAARITSIKQKLAETFALEKALRALPHVTIKAPFRFADAQRQELVNWFENVSLSPGDFSMIIDGFGYFDPEQHPVIYLKPQCGTGITDLQKRVVESLAKHFPQIKPQPHDEAFTPHFTVAYRDLTPERFAEAWQYVQPLRVDEEFQTQSVALLRHDGSQWKIVSERTLSA